MAWHMLGTQYMVHKYSFVAAEDLYGQNIPL